MKNCSLVSPRLENIPTFRQRILRLTTLAYRGAKAIGNFTDAISDPKKGLKIKQSSKEKLFTEAVKVAVAVEVFDKAERQQQGNKYVGCFRNTRKGTREFFHPAS